MKNKPSSARTSGLASHPLTHHHAMMHIINTLSTPPNLCTVHPPRHRAPYS
ncbi:hypothetical protein HMPREF0742_02282 [Rothia aeria F0184]|uniref:Uncharacterized protein n=1 Tax=Rothia aeria F0184 TaxID=888019 RepID=U7UYI2_9MICC|nr:hypothetical protein HMPREF0742_02282 [Rothia aeria F0184]